MGWGLGVGGGSYTNPQTILHVIILYWILNVCVSVCKCACLYVTVSVCLCECV